MNAQSLYQKRDKENNNVTRNFHNFSCMLKTASEHELPKTRRKREFNYQEQLASGLFFQMPNNSSHSVKISPDHSITYVCLFLFIPQQLYQKITIILWANIMHSTSASCQITCSEGRTQVSSFHYINIGHILFILPGAF